MPAGVTVDWTEIKKEYVSGCKSFRQLGKKYGISDRTIRRYADSHDWETDKSVVTAAAKSAAKCGDDQAGNYYDLVSRMSYKLSYAIDNCDGDAKDVRALCAALIDMQKLIGLDKTDLDKQEQKARIAELTARRVEAQRDENKRFVLTLERDDAGD